MRISGISAASPSPASVSHGQSTRRPESSAPAEMPAPDPAEAPATAPSGTAAPEAGSGGEKAHGLVRAADHSHRSDVAALRQWINHPELRADLALPNLDAEHKGNGFQKAVDAYRSVLPATDPAPVVADPPVAGDPAPEFIEPPAAETEPA